MPINKSKTVMLQKPPIEFSKILCVLAIILLIFSIGMAMVCAFLAVDITIFMYIIPTTGTLATASFSFYFFKSKAENLSKQRIRFVLMKLLLEDELDAEDYQEICSEIDNIDTVLNAKLNDMTVDSIEGEDTTGGFDTIQIVEEIGEEVSGRV